MAGQAEPCYSDRIAAASAAVADLVNGIPQGSKIAVRDFLDEVSGRKKGREVRLRVSRVLCRWDCGWAEAASAVSAVNHNLVTNNQVFRIQHST